MTTVNLRIYAVAIGYGLLASAVVLLLVSLAFLVNNARDGAATRALLVECTIPPDQRTPPVDDIKGDCYVRSQARTGEAVGQISNLSILAATCGAAHPGDVNATRDCVEKAMEDR
jgi:hypothetical protein